MKYQFEPDELRQLIADCNRIAIEQYKIEYGDAPATIKKSVAWRKYGRARVEGWERLGLISPIKDGENNSEVRYNRLDLMTLDLQGVRKCLTKH